MTFPDLINGTFESLGGIFIAFSVRKLYRDKVVKGVSWVHPCFFLTWGFWNLYFYPAVGQWLSFYGGAFLATVQAIWFGQMVYYSFYPVERPYVPTILVEHGDAPERYRSEP